MASSDSGYPFVAHSDRGSALPITVTVVGLTVMSLVALPLLLAAGATSEPPAANLLSGAACATSGPIPGLSDVAAANGRTIAAVAFARSGDPGALIVLMAGLAESGLRRLANSTDEESTGLSNEGIGSDHDSVGIFQMRPSWGTVQQRMDPVISTGLLLDRVLAITDWRTQKPWLVAQQVEISAFDGIPRPENGFSSDIGGNYRTQQREATRLLNVIKKDSAHLHCDGGSGVGKPPAGDVGPYGLPVAFVLPNDATPSGRTAVLAALSVLGRPYVFGATGPETFDCSGLTAWAWGKAGVTLPHYTVSQWQSGLETDASHLAPGDLVLTPGSDGTTANPQHVGMFIGSGLVVEAPQTGDVVKVVTYESFISSGLAGLRHIG